MIDKTGHNTYISYLTNSFELNRYIDVKSCFPCMPRKWLLLLLTNGG